LRIPQLEYNFDQFIEVWLRVKGYSNYQVSSRGKVRLGSLQISVTALDMEREEEKSPEVSVGCDSPSDSVSEDEDFSVEGGGEHDIYGRFRQRHDLGVRTETGLELQWGESGPDKGIVMVI
jgi:hypothetical protein